MPDPSPNEPFKGGGQQHGLRVVYREQIEWIKLQRTINENQDQELRYQAAMGLLWRWLPICLTLPRPKTNDEDVVQQWREDSDKAREIRGNLETMSLPVQPMPFVEPKMGHDPEGVYTIAIGDSPVSYARGPHLESVFKVRMDPESKKAYAQATLEVGAVLVDLRVILIHWNIYPKDAEWSEQLGDFTESDLDNLIAKSGSLPEPRSYEALPPPGNGHSVVREDEEIEDPEEVSGEEEP
jgi:hypothetical protein